MADRDGVVGGAELGGEGGQAVRQVGLGLAARAFAGEALAEGGGDGIGRGFVGEARQGTGGVVGFGGFDAQCHGWLGCLTLFLDSARRCDQRG